MDARERKRLIDLYRDGYRVVAEALEGISDAELDRSATNDWTPRQIAHHLADSEMESATRIRRRLRREGFCQPGLRPAHLAVDRGDAMGA
jgi:hypothetical protein